MCFIMCIKVKWVLHHFIIVSRPLAYVQVEYSKTWKKHNVWWKAFATTYFELHSALLGLAIFSYKAIIVMTIYGSPASNNQPLQSQKRYNTLTWAHIYLYYYLLPNFQNTGCTKRLSLYMGAYWIYRVHKKKGSTKIKLWIESFMRDAPVNCMPHYPPAAVGGEGWVFFLVLNEIRAYGVGNFWPLGCSSHQLIASQIRGVEGDLINWASQMLGHWNLGLVKSPLFPTHCPRGDSGAHNW